MKQECTNYKLKHITKHGSEVTEDTDQDTVGKDGDDTCKEQQYHRQASVDPLSIQHDDIEEESPQHVQGKSGSSHLCNSVCSHAKQARACAHKMPLRAT